MMTSAKTNVEAYARMMSAYDIMMMAEKVVGMWRRMRGQKG